MPALQTTYNERMSVAAEGMIADMRTKTLKTRIAEGGSIGFGKVVVKGTGDKQSILPTAGGTFDGITVLDKSQDGRNNDAYPEYETMSLITKGPIWIKASVAVSAGDPVYFTDAGVLTNVATDNTQIDGAEFETSTTGADELAIVVLG